MATDPTKTATATPTLTGELLPDVTSLGSTEVVSLSADELTRPKSKVSRERAAELAKAIDLKDTTSIINFGVAAQRDVTSISQKMLDGVRTKDTGPVGDTMNSMVHEMRGLDFKSLTPGQKQGFFAKLLGKASSLTLFLQKYETVASKIKTTQNVLDSHRVQLLKDIVALDRLYDATLAQLSNLDEQIAAVQFKLEETNNVIIPTAQETAARTGDMADIQIVRDLSEARDELERKLHNLELSRTVTIQALPSIRIVQSNDKGLVNKIQTQILNTLPLWEQTMARTIAAYRAEEAGKASKSVTDYTNDLLIQSAEQLKSSNRVARTEIERGIFDVEAAIKANDLLIETLNESIDLAQQGKEMRKSASAAMAEAEAKLKTALMEAANRQAALR